MKRLPRNLNTEPWEPGELQDECLKKIRMDEIKAMIELDQTFDEGELAKALRYAYTTIKNAKRNGMPFYDGRIRRAVALKWMEEQALLKAEAPEPRPYHPGGLGISQKRKLPPSP